MSFVKSSDGVRLAVEVIGGGEPITVVGHGLTQNRKAFGALAPFLPGTTVLFDFRGHGESDHPPAGSYSYDRFAADVEAVADAYEATRIVGMSLGGGSTLRLLESRPDRFERLVFILPARLERSDQARTRLLRLADILESHPLEEAAELVVAEELSLGGFDGQPGAVDIRRWGILQMNGDGIPLAIRELIDEPAVRDVDAIRRKVTAPALVIGQEGDQVHRADVARELAGALRNSELVMLENPSAWMDQLPVLVQRVAAFVAD